MQDRQVFAERYYSKFVFTSFAKDYEKVLGVLEGACLMSLLPYHEIVVPAQPVPWQVVPRRCVCAWTAPLLPGASWSTSDSADAALSASPSNVSNRRDLSRSATIFDASNDADSHPPVYVAACSNPSAGASDAAADDTIYPRLASIHLQQHDWNGLQVHVLVDVSCLPSVESQTRSAHQKGYARGSRQTGCL